MTRLCDDCGAHAAWEISSVREETAAPCASTAIAACNGHRLDATEHMLNQYGNVTIYEVLG